MKVQYGNKIIKNNEKINLEISQEKPIIYYEFDKNKVYTIMMIDCDPPSRENPINRYWLHWLIINNNQEINPYNPPNPPKNSGDHRYNFCIFEQSNKIDLKEILERPKFNVEKFVQDNNLKFVSTIRFIIKN